MNDHETQQRQAIADVLIGYCDAVDQGDIEGLVERFTVEAAVDYGPRTSATGRAALTELFGRLLGTATATSHRLTNIVVDVHDASSASALSYVTAWHELVRPVGEQLIVHGRYLDRLRNVGGRWLIDERRLEVHGASAPVPFHLVDRRITSNE